MTFLKKIKFKKIKNLAKILAQRPILTFLLLFSFVFISAILIFYQENILARKRIPEVKEKLVEFEEKTYQEILKIWQEKEKKFQEADLKIYPDPFR
jgi:hypothetical protein